MTRAITLESKIKLFRDLLYDGYELGRHKKVTRVVSKQHDDTVIHRQNKVIITSL